MLCVAAMSSFFYFNFLPPGSDVLSSSAASGPVWSAEVGVGLSDELRCATDERPDDSVAARERAAVLACLQNAAFGRYTRLKLVCYLLP
jgi:hypothetical protein